jgi:hypothetical protein
MPTVSVLEAQRRSQERSALEYMLPELSKGSPEAYKKIYRYHLDAAISAFQSEPAMIRHRSEKAVIIGDLHGDLGTFAKIMRTYPPSEYDHLLLGDVVDRGNQSTELLALLLAYKLIYGDRFRVLRGDHEGCGIGQLTPQQFPQEFISKMGDRELLDKVYDDLFPELPMAIVLNDRYFLVHGGVPVQNLQVSDLVLPKVDDPRSENRTFYQMMWADPKDTPGLRTSERSPYTGGIKNFGPDVADAFLKTNGLELLIRGHEHRLEGRILLGKTLTLLTTTAYQKNGKVVDDQQVAKVEADGLEVYSVASDSPVLVGSIADLMRKNSN